MSDSLNKSLDELIQEERGSKNFNRQRNFQRPYNQQRDRQRQFRPQYEKQQNYYNQKSNYRNDDENNEDEEEDVRETQHVIHKQIRKTSNQAPRKQIFTKKYQNQNKNNQNDENEDDNDYQTVSHNKRLKITNLNKKIDNTELRELFQTHGKLVKCGIIWDDLGYSTGKAIVEFERESSALKAKNEYDGAELDGEVLGVAYVDSE